MIHVVDQVECLYKAKTLLPPMVVNEMISQFMDKKQPTTWRLAAMNLAIRGLAADLGKEPGDTFGNDRIRTVDYIVQTHLLIFLTGVEKIMKMILVGYMVDLQ